MEGEKTREISHGGAIDAGHRLAEAKRVWKSGGAAARGKPGAFFQGLIERRTMGS
jgi:hypothetical protein